MVKEVTRQGCANEDLPMLEAQQRAMTRTDFWAEKPIVFAQDAGVIRARQVLEQLIRKEQAVRSEPIPAASREGVV
jgi:Vanillate O-demethylase oxygenase C-terminal domain